MMLRIVMYSKGRGKIFCLPDVEKDTITEAAPSYEKYQVTFVAMDHQWYALKPGEMTWNDGEDTRERCLHHEMSLILKNEDAMIGIYCSEILQEDTRFGKYVLNGETLQIGRHQECEVCSPDKRLSDHHGVLKVSEDHASYADTSKNGSFINGVFIRNEEKEIRTGDLIAFASGLQLVYLGSNVIGISGIGGGSVALQTARAYAGYKGGCYVWLDPSGNWWYNQSQDTKNVTEQVTVYRSRTVGMQYTYQKWGSWSGWTSNWVAQSDTRQVESRTVNGDWSAWQDGSSSSSGSTEVQTRKLYRYQVQ